MKVGFGFDSKSGWWGEKVKLKLKGYYSKITVEGIGEFEANVEYEFDEEAAKKLLETGAWEVVVKQTESVNVPFTVTEGGDKFE
jgi:hypothetical protein